MIVLGIDPGYERCGIALLKRHGRDTLEVLFSTCIVTPKELPHAERLQRLGTALSDIISTHTPDVCAVETLFFSKNKKTALGVAEARGTLLFIAAQAGLAVHEYGPAAVKIAITGHGHSTKENIMIMLPKLLSLPHTPTYDDEYDALAVALTHCVSTP